MSRSVAFIYDDQLARHVLPESHPMRPIRLRYTYELLQAYGIFAHGSAQLVPPRPATEEELLGFHTPEYVRAVRSFNDGRTAVDPRRFNMGPGDNPVYRGIYDAAALSTGASVQAAELVASGAVQRAFSIAGGLHHAMRGYASGFCVFNDPVIAINALLARGRRVAYVDIDCHHGDGVQHAFYDTDAVLTISLHESGAFLFPGTGFIQETGAGLGRGYSVNLPLYPRTDDGLYLWAVREVVTPVLGAFKPDVLVTQLGVDTHFKDPITHMGLTVQGFGSVVSELARGAPRWVALGGGGYDVQAVARAWAMAYGIMLGRELPDRIPETYARAHGVATLSDADRPAPDPAEARDAKVFAQASVQAVKRLIFPLHGLSAG